VPPAHPAARETEPASPDPAPARRERRADGSFAPDLRAYVSNAPTVCWESTPP